MWDHWGLEVRCPNLTTIMKTAGATGIALLALTGSALADGSYGSVKDAPADEGRKLTWSVSARWHLGHHVPRPVADQRRPGAWGSLDLGYGIVYAGVYFGQTDYAGVGAGELDFYLGVKPVLGPVTFDFGVIYYVYPGSAEAPNPGGSADYVELKAGGSITPITNLTLGVTELLVAREPVLDWLGLDDRRLGRIYAPGCRHLHADDLGVYGFQEGFDDEYITKASAFGEEATSTGTSASPSRSRSSPSTSVTGATIWAMQAVATQATTPHSLATSSFVFSAKVTLP